MHEIRHSVCPHDCPSQCALVVTVDDGRVTDVGGDPSHAFTRGVVCGKVHDYAERVYAPTRVLTPLRRVGAKGEGRFEPPNRFFLNSSFSQSDMLRRRQRGASVFLHPEDVRPRGIADGDAVTVRSARGEARFTATLTDDTRPGLAVIEGIWWCKQQSGGRGVNVITDDRLADMGGGPALHSNVVQVARL